MSYRYSAAIRKELTNSTICVRYNQRFG